MLAYQQVPSGLFANLDITPTKKPAREFDPSKGDRKSPTLRNGAQLKYRLFWDKTVWRFSGTIWNDLLTTVKEKRATLHLWPTWAAETGVRHSVIAADFDHLPDQFASWDQFYSYLWLTYTEWDVVRSPSGKCKIFIEVIHQYPMCAQVAEAFLKSELAPRDFDIVDTSVGGMSLCYASHAIVDSIANLKTNFEAKVINDLETAVRGSITIPNTHKMYKWEKEIPQFLRFFVGSNKKKEALARILLSCWNLRESFNLPVEKLARECGCDAMSISRWLKQLQKCHLLVCVDDSYEWRKKAKTYKAKHALKSHLDSVAKKGVKAFSKPIPMVAPSKGEFYAWALSAARTIDVDTMAGMGLINSKRLKEYQRIRKCYERKGQLAYGT